MVAAAGCGACWMQATPTAKYVKPNTAEETVRGIYDIPDHKTGAATVEQFALDLQEPEPPGELNRLGRTLERWKTRPDWHAARVTNAPTEAVNNLMKRVKRAALGFRDFANYRIRALVYAGKPNWELLDSLTIA